MIRLIVSIPQQVLEVRDGDALVKTYCVSTSRYGVGEQEGSLCTPLGRHKIRAKIGAGLPTGSVFSGRRPTGAVLTAALLAREPERDWILSRILWLSGCEPGHNRLGLVDTMRRYIYIHGTAHEDKLGTPASIGCVRMANTDVMELFAAVPVGTVVDINA